MKYSILIILLSTLLLTSCSEHKEKNDFDFRYITNVEVLSHNAIDVAIDNFMKTISFVFERGQDLSKVELKLILSDGVEIVKPQSIVATYDLSNKATIQCKKNSEVVTFNINVYYKSAPLRISSSSWEKKDDFGNLPGYISVYKYKKDIRGKLVQAYIAVADVGPGNGKFKVVGNKKGYHTLSEFYNENSYPKVIMNGGYFWSGTSLGLMIKNGETVSKVETSIKRKYKDTDTYYYPTQGAFGMYGDGTFSAQWVYHSNDILYAYPAPAANKYGEEPLPKPSSIFPEGAQIWQPIEAISAGPLLIKNKEYKNLWENEFFDEASGVGPNYNHPRSAIAYHPKGYLIFFVCEGRNKTPNTPGMTLKNVADLLLEIGCSDAINLDGGGSSCMLINGKGTIIPSNKNGQQRKITNAVAIY